MTLTHKVFVSRDVHFEENIFPFHKESSRLLQHHTPTSYLPIAEVNTPFSPLHTHLSDDTLPLSSSPPATQVVHEIPRRTSRVHKPPTWLQDYAYSINTDTHYPLFQARDFQNYQPEYITSLHNVLSIKEPYTYDQAIKDPRWIEAMNNEIAALEANHIWDITILPPDKRAISFKWVYKIKFKPDRTIERFKARFVVRGFNQIKDKDYKHTFFLVAKLPTVRVLIALTTTKGWPIHQLDINNAFFHGTLDEEVYIIPPEGYEKAKGKVCKLNKSLYGLKQASRQWNKEFTQFLLRNGFSQSKQDYSLFTKGTIDSQSFLAVLVYVDDSLITGENLTHINDLKHKIHEAFTIKDLGLIRYFLGIEVSRTTNGTTLHQRKYILDILQDLGLSACKSTAFPLPTNLKLSTDDGDLISHPE